MTMKNCSTILPLETYKALVNKKINEKITIRFAIRQAIENYVNEEVKN